MQCLQGSIPMTLHLFSILLLQLLSPVAAKEPDTVVRRNISLAVNVSSSSPLSPPSLVASSPFPTPTEERPTTEVRRKVASVVYPTNSSPPSPWATPYLVASSPFPTPTENRPTTEVRRNASGVLIVTNSSPPSTSPTTSPSPSVVASSPFPTEDRPGTKPPEASETSANKKIQRRLIIILTVVASIVVAVLCSGAFLYLWRKKRLRREIRSSHEHLFGDMGLPTGMKITDKNIDGENQVGDHGLPMISLATIQSATNNFSDATLLGRGGFGPVYKGILLDGKEIAVKRLAKGSGQGLEEFKNEVILIAKLQHRNLVRLLCCCIENEEKLLVYEYMPNTSLDFFLFDPSKRAQLDWRRRIHIIGGITRGLLYLHEDSRLRIIHRDLKASNILLDHEMNPKISDFGMARIFGGNQNQANTNRVVGTYGYMSPEYAMAGLFSVKSDVFSFGVLLLEIVSGKRNTSRHLPGDAQSLLTYAWRLWCDGNGLELMDQSILETCVASEVLRFIHIGLLCVQEDAADRPTMSSVLLMLGSDVTTLPKPSNPGFFVGRVVESNQSLVNSKICSVNEVTISDLDPR